MEWDSRNNYSYHADSGLIFSEWNLQFGQDKIATFPSYNVDLYKNSTNPTKPTPVA